MSAPVIGALLSEERMLRKVDKLVRGQAVLYALPTWDTLAALVGTGPVDAIFIDPLVELRANWGERMQHLNSRRQQVILYTTLTPELAAVLLHMGRAGVREVVFSRLDDHTDRLTEALASTGVRLITEWCPY